ncbi:MAG: site-specific DNA-methyltransferase [Bacteroidetes bacterium]|nr:site-specific DNA-methyltransferase [Bacteroidota bacterium]
MPTTDQLRNKLKEKLQELFQLDQPELDFGFYRIMHAKAEQVNRFLENDLLAEVQQAFADGTSAKQAELKQTYEDALAQAKKYGVPDPENSAPVQEAKGRWTDALDTTKAEAEVYDHLYRFFERYYEDGDFVSRRYLTRETAGKAAPYAVPYDGQEVMLHWANRDQYYIKTSEHFDHYTFDAREAARQLRQAAKTNKDQEALDLGNDLLEGKGPLRVHFRLVEAAEGEHNNVKESGDKKRFFLPHAARPVALDANGELQLHFEYRPLPGGYQFDEDHIKKTYEVGNKGDLPANWMADVFLRALAQLPGDAAKAATALLATKAPTDKQKKRTLLAKYIAKYTATNSKDYFIHKDLGGFLRRELDFYLKNEVMRLDDLEGAEAPRVEHYLAKLKVIRRIAHKLCDFLAQLENFQKRLWLKKKFVVETNWCITLDRVPQALYPAIAANAAQKAEWEKLFAIADLPGYEATKPLSVDFLKANPYLVLDTAFLSEAEKAELLNTIDDLDAQCNGLLVHSENFQALRLLEGRYREQVKCVYIDPPYNTGEDGFIYKDEYQQSSWASMIADRIAAGRLLQAEGAPTFVSIDDHESHRLRMLLDACYGKTNYVGLWNWFKSATPPNLSKKIKDNIEYLYGYENGPSKVTYKGKRKFSPSDDPLTKPQNTLKELKFEPGWIEIGMLDQIFEPGMYGTEKYPNELLTQLVVKGGTNANEVVFRNRFTWTQPKLAMEIGAGTKMKIAASKLVLSYKKTDYGEEVPPNFIDWNVDVGTTEEAGKRLRELFPAGLAFSYPKPKELIQYVLGFNDTPNATVLDFFAGSGTTGHAVVDLNRESDEKESGTGMRKYLLVEMGDYFDAITRPRMQKVVYSRTWKDGKPVDREGISHCFKYLRLESYEDTLNALELRSDAEREKLLAAHKPLREDYTLRYLLDVETKDSSSLLNHTAFTDPRAYTLNVKKPGSEERTTKTVDLLETFNYLLGLRVQHVAAPETYTAAFERVQEPDVPKDQPQRLVVKGNLKPVQAGSPLHSLSAAEGGRGAGGEGYWFRRVQGWMPRDRHKPHGERDKVLIIWRSLTTDREQDNAVLDTWFTKNRLEIRDREYDVIYVNGSNNLPNLLQAGERWKVRLIEDDFHRLMWEGAE